MRKQFRNPDPNRKEMETKKTKMENTVKSFLPRGPLSASLTHQLTNFSRHVLWHYR